MADYNSVFKRVEKKHRIDPAQRSAVEMAALENMEIDGYGRTLITSLYLDTPGRDMIARSIEKPLYKEKLRLRAYGEKHSQALMNAFCACALVRSKDDAPLSETRVDVRCMQACEGTGLVPQRVPVFFEIKKKFKGIVYKRRLVMSLPAALAFVSGLTYEQASMRWPLVDESGIEKTPKRQERQIARELAATMDRWMPLVPSMGIACYREAWRLRDAKSTDALDPQLRITFDDSLQYFDRLEEQSEWKSIIPEDEAIMEIKSAGAYAPWLIQSLSNERIYPASFTKYGTAYQLASKEEKPCSIQHSHRYMEALSR